MKNTNKKFYLLGLSFILVLLSFQFENEKTFNDVLVIWETDSFTVEVENSTFIEKMGARKIGWGDTFDNFEKKLKTETRNLFELANHNSSELFMIESWTGNAYKRKSIIVRNKLSGKIETDLTEREYSDVGTSGIEVYIRGNKLLKIIEFVY